MSRTELRHGYPGSASSTPLIQLSTPKSVLIMPPRRVGRGRLSRRYVDEQELPYAPGVQPQGEVSNAEFRGSSTTEDPKNFIEELKKIFDVIHVADIELVELAAYQLKDVARTWFD
ncbi:hypothetical protein MTR67_038000 [Solanum verrucosum]|uniref:Gag-pol polyprotein n=1 Tax=Solanum verrucosum TaxID=315347 RepID=A0AAF0ZP71_SOLVR|nr:hypothetical protein MTR67_038000 [Solanum verrucosum]